MEVLKLTILISGGLAFIGVVLFAWTVKSRTFDHADRLALLPLAEDKYTDPAANAEFASDPQPNVAAASRADAEADESVTSPS